MRVAETPPAYCSGCMQAGAEKQYLDFEVAWDGPVVGHEIKVVIDDLVLCQECVKGAAALLGLAGLAAEERATYEAAAKHQEAEIAEKDKVIRDYEHTVRALEEHPVTRQGGKPALRGLSKQGKQTILEQQKLDRAERKAKVRAKKKVAA